METKVDSPPPVASPASSNKRARYSYISEKIILQFQPSVDPDDIPYEQIRWWKDIFSYIQPNDYERIHLRRLCNMFNASLKEPPKGIFAEFPHVNHASLDSLISRLNELYRVIPTRAPTVLFIKEGNHEVNELYLCINYPIKIIGAGQNKTFLSGGGFKIQGSPGEGKEDGKVEAEEDENKEKDENNENTNTTKVELFGMTIQDTAGDGVIAFNSLPFVCDRVRFTKCRKGMYVKNTTGRLINCVITQCEHSGIVVSKDALVTLEGPLTKVDVSLPLEPTPNAKLDIHV